jgi:hypothetical protein
MSAWQFGELTCRSHRVVERPDDLRGLNLEVGDEAVLRGGGSCMHGSWETFHRCGRLHLRGADIDEGDHRPARAPSASTWVVERLGLANGRTTHSTRWH